MKFKLFRFINGEVTININNFSHKYIEVEIKKLGLNNYQLRIFDGEKYVGYPIIESCLDDAKYTAKHIVKVGLRYIKLQEMDRILLNR